MILGTSHIPCHVSDHATWPHRTHLARRCRDASSRVRVPPARLCLSAQPAFVISGDGNVALSACAHSAPSTAERRPLPCGCRRLPLLSALPLYLGLADSGRRCDAASGGRLSQAATAPRASTVGRARGLLGKDLAWRPLMSALPSKGQQDERPREGACRRGCSWRFRDHDVPDDFEDVELESWP